MLFPCKANFYNVTLRNFHKSDSLVFVTHFLVKFHKFKVFLWFCAKGNTIITRFISKFNFSSLWLLLSSLFCRNYIVFIEFLFTYRLDRLALNLSDCINLLLTHSYLFRFPMIISNIIERGRSVNKKKSIKFKQL